MQKALLNSRQELELHELQNIFILDHKIHCERSHSPTYCRAQDTVGGRLMLVMCYGCIMRTTIAIADELLSKAKHAARMRNESLGGFVEDAIRTELNLQQGQRLQLEIPVIRGRSGLRTGVDITSGRAILEVLGRDKNLDQIR